MSLLVWLPLNGNLNNQGLSNITFSNTEGSTVIEDSDGKIGHCYKRTSKATAGKIISDSTINLTGDLSMCCWAKVTDAVVNTANGLISNHSHNDKTGFGITVKYVSDTDFRMSCNSGDGTNRTFHTYYGTTNIKDKWCHLCLTYDNTAHIFKLYVNGVCENTVSYTNASKDDYLLLFDWSTTFYSDSYKPACCLNDVRIYDNCLSQKEVSELAKGLVLHYKLNNIFSDNVIPFDLVSSNYTISNYNNRTPGTISNGIYHVDGYQSSSSIDTSFGILSNNYITLESNTDYYLSFNCKSKSDNDLFFGTSGQAYTGLIDNSNVRYYPESQVTIGKQFSGRVSLKFHTGSATQYKIFIGFDGPNIYGIGSYIEFNQIMLSKEFSNYYNSYGSNIHTIYDYSGYNNNGTVTGTLTLGGDSIRHKYCTYFENGLTGKITAPINLNNDAVTMNLWVKSKNGIAGTGNYHIPFVINQDCYEFSIASSGKFRNGFRINGTRTVGDFGTDIISDKKWHMISATYDGTNIKRYIDGALVNTTAVTGTLTGGSLTVYMGTYGASNTYGVKELYLSDARIYTTPLSEDDINELYKTSSIIDNIGNIYCYDASENETSLKIYKTGLVNIDNYIELGDRIKVLDDGSVWLQILHHNNPASNLFTNSNCWCYNDGNNLYSTLFLLKDGTWCNNDGEYEFLASEKLESTSAEAQYRWKQTSNPALSSTCTGYAVISGNPPRDCGLMNKGTYAAMHNGASWWCACGSWSNYNGGIPGFGGTVKSGYLDLYVRKFGPIIKGATEKQCSFYEKTILTNKILEI